MTPAVLLHYHEIGLKGKNRHVFEKKFVDAIRRILHGFVDPRHVVCSEKRVLIRTKSEKEWKNIRARLPYIFGTAYALFGYSTDATLAAITDAAGVCVQYLGNTRIHLETKRSDKTFPLTSPEVNHHIVAAIEKGKGVSPFSVRDAKTTLRIEIMHSAAFLGWQRVDGPGGLPTGSSGRLLALLSGGIDSPVAAWKMMRRGAHVDLIHIHSYPYTSKSSIENVTALATQLARYGGASSLFLVPFGDIQKKIVTSTAPARYRVVLYRRCMFRIAERIAYEHKALGLITGESLGQVASQTVENMQTIDAATALPVYRPLIGSDKQEIITHAQAIGTYDISIRPADDCCSLFTPKHPATKTTTKELDRIEADLSISAWIDELLRKTERKIIDEAW